MNTNAKLVLSDAWEQVIHVVKKYDGHEKPVAPDVLSEADNQALEKLTQSLLNMYQHTAVTRDNAVCQAVCKQWVNVSSNKKVQFNIPNQNISIESVMKRHNDSKWVWPNLWEIKNNMLTCVGLDVRCLVKMESLNTLFCVDDTHILRDLKTIFGTVYSGKTIHYENGIIVVVHNELRHSISELCNRLNTESICAAESSEWLTQYLQPYIDTLNRLKA